MQAAEFRGSGKRVNATAVGQIMMRARMEGRMKKRGIDIHPTCDFLQLYSRGCIYAPFPPPLAPM